MLEIGRAGFILVPLHPNSHYAGVFKGVAQEPGLHLLGTSDTHWKMPIRGEAAKITQRQQRRAPGLAFYDKCFNVVQLTACKVMQHSYKSQKYVLTNDSQTRPKV